MNVLSNMRSYLFIPLFILFITAPNSYSQYRIVNAFPGLSFDAPVVFTFAADGSKRLYIVELPGKIIVFQNDSTVTSSNTFLDITNKVVAGGEQGLLGVAFHPNFLANGFFYVYYTKAVSGDIAIERYTRSASNPLATDTASHLLLLTVPHSTFTNHNGGSLFFGLDGFLYAGVGDGGSGSDPNNNGQNTNVLLGKILRLDVDNPSVGNNYGVPSTNPYVTGGGRPEIFCIGMRNPWRVSQDPVSGLIYAGDVGQNIYEEVDIISNGANYGWRVMEGFHCYNPPEGCNSAGLTLPIKEYDHNGNGCAITGGYVYRGARMPGLVGCYFYGDYCSNNIWILKYENGTVTQDRLLMNATIPYASLSSFGVDQNNELYICALPPPGNIYRIEAGTSDPGGGIVVITGFSLGQNYPNPFNPSTDIKYEIYKSAFVTLKIYNAAGEEVSVLVNENKTANTYTISWSASDFPSGVYYYILTAKGINSATVDYTQARKMVFIK